MKKRFPLRDRQVNPFFLLIKKNTQVLTNAESESSDIFGMFLVEATVVNSILTVRNPAGNAAALTITPLASGTSPASAHLVVIQMLQIIPNVHVVEHITHIVIKKIKRMLTNY